MGDISEARTSGEGVALPGEVLESTDLLRREGPTRAPLTDEAIRARVLRGTDPWQILHRIAESDPLRMHELCGRFLRECAWLIEATRFRERALVRVAYEASRTEAVRPDGAWLRTQMEWAVRSLLTEDHEEERRAPLSVEEEDERYRWIWELFLLEPGTARLAAVRFNGLPFRTRQAFYWLLMDAKPIAECLERGGWTEESLQKDVRTGLAALGLLDETEITPTAREGGA